MTQKNSEFTVSQLAQTLKYTRMTISRVFDELEASGVGCTTQKGRERVITLEKNKSKLLEQAKPFLKNPMKKRIWAKSTPPSSFAGLSALAKQSMLGAPPIPIYAIEIKAFKTSNIIELPDSEGADYALELWAYDPCLFSKNDCVDALSLSLTLEGNKDERVTKALDELMEAIDWL